MLLLRVEDPGASYSPNLDLSVAVPYLNINPELAPDYTLPLSQCIYVLLLFYLIIPVETALSTSRYMRIDPVDIFFSSNFVISVSLSRFIEETRSN